MAQDTQTGGSGEAPHNVVTDLIRRKHAVRQFQDKPVPREMIRSIIDAGRRSGSWRNSQPWRFVVIEDAETRARLADLNSSSGHVRGAAFGVVVVAPDPPPSGSPEFDFGRMVQNMMLAALAFDVGSVIGYVNDPEKTADLLGLPDSGYRVAWLISFGYPADPDNMKSGHQRQPFDEIVHWERW